MDQQIKQVKKKRRHGCLITVIAILGAFIALVVILANTVGNNPPAKQSTLAKALELTDEQEFTMVQVFNACGIGDIVDATVFKSGEARTSYYVNDKETAAFSGADRTIIVWVDNSTKAVQEIYFNDITIYADGEVKANLPDYYISEALRDTYRTAAQVCVNNCLNYPDTAKYPGIYEWRFGVHDGLDVVQSTVTAKNAFGVQDKMEFTIKFDRSTGAPVSLVLNGQEYIK